MSENVLEEIISKAHMLRNDGVPFVQASNFSRSDYMSEQIFSMIQSFEKTLSEDREIAVKFLPYTESFAVNSVGYILPDLLLFWCRDSQNNLQLHVRHTTQVNLVLESAKRKDDLSLPRRKIGFVAMTGQESAPTE